LGGPQSDAEAQRGLDGSSSLACELANCRGYFAARLAALRATLPPGELAAAIRALKTEEAQAIQAIIQRWQAYFQNRQQDRTAGPARPASSLPVLRYPGLRRN
jgi:hypothetical protein